MLYEWVSDGVKECVSDGVGEFVSRNCESKSKSGVFLVVVSSRSCRAEF